MFQVVCQREIEKTFLCKKKKIIVSPKVTAVPRLDFTVAKEIQNHG